METEKIVFEVCSVIQFPLDRFNEHIAKKMPRFKGVSLTEKSLLVQQAISCILENGSVEDLVASALKKLHDEIN